MSTTTERNTDMSKLIIGGLAMAMATMANASELTKDWDKTFPKSDKVEHAKAMCHMA